MTLSAILKKAVFFIPAFCITGISWYLSSKTHIQNLPHIVGFDKILHFIGYAGLAFWTAFALLPRDACAKNYRHRLIIAFLYPVLYGTIDEIHQYYVPGRDASLSDLITDIIGTLIGIWVYVKLRDILTAWRKKRELCGG